MDGCDVQTEMDEIRKSLGICPQHNMLFPDLSVMEHFIMFGMVINSSIVPNCILLFENVVKSIVKKQIILLQIKGLSRQDSIKQGQEYIQRLNLQDKTNVVTNKLSGNKIIML